MGAGGAFHTETVRANPNLRGMETLFGSRGGAEKARDTHAALKVGRATESWQFVSAFRYKYVRKTVQTVSA